VTRVSKPFIDDQNSSRYRQRRLSDEACFVDEECGAKSACEFLISFSWSHCHIRVSHALIMCLFGVWMSKFVPRFRTDLEPTRLQIYGMDAGGEMDMQYRYSMYRIICI